MATTQTDKSKKAPAKSAQSLRVKKELADKVKGGMAGSPQY